MIGCAAKSTFESRRGTARPRNSVVQPANPEPDGPTRAARARNSGVPVRELAGFANARPGFQGPDSQGGRRGSNGGAVCLVSCRF
jgi:hypothetical protein